MKRRPIRIDAPPGTEIVIRIPAEAAPAAERPLTPCESDVLEVLSDGRTLSRAELVAELCDGGPHAHGESTVEHALTRLVKAGLLQKGPENKGYRRAEKS